MKVDLQLKHGEIVEDSCLSLSAADDIAGNKNGDLSPENLSVSLDQTRRGVEIRSRKPFNELFAKLRLQVKCSGMGEVSKIFVVLPEIATVPQKPVVIQIELPPLSEQPSATDTMSVTPISLPTAIVVADIPLNPKTRKPNQPTPSSKITNKHASHKNTTFQLKISGDALDLSRIGTLSAADLKLLHMQQQLLAEDEQTARFQAMQQQIRLMQDEMEAMPAKMIKQEVAASPVSASLPIIVATKAPPANNHFWQIALLIVSFLVATVFTWLGLRYYENIKPKTLPPNIANDDPLAQPELPVLKHMVEITSHHRPTEQTHNDSENAKL